MYRSLPLSLSHQAALASPRSAMSSLPSSASAII